MSPVGCVTYVSGRSISTLEGFGTPLLEQALESGAVLVRYGGNVDAIDLDSDFDRLILFLGHVSGCLPGKYACLCSDGMVLLVFSKDYANSAPRHE